MNYQHHFGEQSSDYLQFRPDYPDALYQYLASMVANREVAWDCGTGNGQAAAKLADYFRKVIATDLNEGQLRVAIQKANITYYQASAESSHIPDESVDLITVAQALHWFHFSEFYQEAKRVSRKSGMIAAWCYSLGHINKALDSVIKKLYSDILGDQYWPKERHYIDESYQTIPFPFKKIATPQFEIVKEITFSELLGYLNTWSAIKEYKEKNQANALDLITAELANAWGNYEIHNMHWPLHLLLANVHL